MADPAQVMRNIAKATVNSAMGDYPGFLSDDSQTMHGFGSVDDMADFVSKDADQQYLIWGVSSWVRDSEGNANVVKE